MNPFRQFCNSFLWIWLVILVPVYIGKAPEKCVISQFSGHRQILCTVDALWGAVKFCHFFSGGFLIKNLHIFKLLLKGFLCGYAGHIRVCHGVVAYGMACIYDLTDQFRFFTDQSPHNKKCGMYLMLM